MSRSGSNNSAQGYREYFDENGNLRDAKAGEEFLNLIKDSLGNFESVKAGKDTVMLESALIGSFENISPALRDIKGELGQQKATSALSAFGRSIGITGKGAKSGNRLQAFNEAVAIAVFQKAAEPKANFLIAGHVNLKAVTKANGVRDRLQSPNFESLERAIDNMTANFYDSRNFSPPAPKRMSAVTSTSTPVAAEYVTNAQAKSPFDANTYNLFRSKGLSASTEADGPGIQSLGGDLGDSTETDGDYAEVRKDAARVSVVGSPGEAETLPVVPDRPSRDSNQQTGGEYVAPTPFSGNPQGEVEGDGDYAEISTLGLRRKILPSMVPEGDQRTDDNGKYSAVQPLTESESDYLVPSAQGEGPDPYSQPIDSLLFGNGPAPEPPTRPSREVSSPIMTEAEIAAAEMLLGLVPSKDVVPNNSVSQNKESAPSVAEEAVTSIPKRAPDDDIPSMARRPAMPDPRKVFGLHTAKALGKGGPEVGSGPVVGRHTASAVANKGSGMQQGQ